MISIFVDARAPGGRIREKLEELVLAHRWEAIAAADQVKLPLPPGARLPALVDGDTVVCGEENILAYLEELARFKAEWDRFQSDSCYCGPDGEVE